MVDLSLIVPAYNEAAVIARSLDRLVTHLDEAAGAPGAWTAWEIIVVDDGSTDATGDIARNASRRDARVRVVSLQRNGGKGGAVAEGVARARGSWVLATDADLSYALSDIAVAVRALRGGDGGGLDMVAGDRRHQDSRVQLPVSSAARRVRRRQAISRLFSAFARRFFGLTSADTQCGLKAFRREAAEAIMARLRTRGFLSDIEMFIIAERLGLRIGSVPVHLLYLSDASTVNVGRLLPHVLADAIRIRMAQMTGWYGPWRLSGTGGRRPGPGP